MTKLLTEQWNDKEYLVLFFLKQGTSKYNFKTIFITLFFKKVGLYFKW